MRPYENQLKLMFTLQNRLQKGYGHNFDTMSSAERVDFIRTQILALEDELHEALAEVHWKPWSSSSGEEALFVHSAEAFLSELVDAFHFLMNLILVGGFGSSDFFEKYLEKQARNLQRQANNYDATEGKCRVCGVDRSDMEALGLDPDLPLYCQGAGHTW